MLGLLLTGCVTSQPESVSIPTTYKPIIPTATAIATYTYTPAPTAAPTLIPPKITINSADNQIYLEGFSSYIKSLVWSKDGKTLIIGDTYNGVVSFDVENKNIATNPITPIWEIALNPDKTTLSVNYGDERFAKGQVSFVNLETGSISKTISVERAIDFFDGKAYTMNGSTGAIFAPDGETFVLNNGKQITLWDIASGKQIKELLKSDNNLFVKRLFLNSAKDSLIAVYFDTDSEGIFVWDTNTWELTSTKKFDWVYSSLAFSPDGNSFATTKDLYVQKTQEVIIWNFNTFTKLIDFINLGEPVDSPVSLNIITYDPSGKYIAVGNTSNINIYNASTGKLIRHLVTSLGTGFGSIHVLSFSPDGNNLAVGGSWTGQVGKVQVMIWKWNQP
jgi:WD40 repeat protein